MSKRIYKVKDVRVDAPRLVKASTPAQAIRHVAKDTFTASVATQDDLVGLVLLGVKVEEVGDEAE